MSPILVRPVREQLEHDRVIRLLQAKLKRKHEVAINVGDEQPAGIKIGPGQMFPDLVLTSQDKAHRLEGVIEVETGESVNHLEAMAQWAHFGRARAPFHLYVPAAAVDIARRLCLENNVSVSEIWSYHTLGDQTRFTLVAKIAQKRRAPAPLPWRRSRPPKPKAKPAVPKANGTVKAKSATAAKPQQSKGADQARGEQEEEVSPAATALQSRQARIRNDRADRDRCATPRPRAGAASPVLVPHPAGRARRTRPDRRGSDSAARAAQPRHRIRLDADPQGPAARARRPPRARRPR